MFTLYFMLLITDYTPPPKKGTCKNTFTTWVLSNSLLLKWKSSAFRAYWCSMITENNESHRHNTKYFLVFIQSERLSSHRPVSSMKVRINFISLLATSTLISCIKGQIHGNLLHRWALTNASSENPYNNLFFKFTTIFMWGDNWHLSIFLYHVFLF